MISLGLGMLKDMAVVWKTDHDLVILVSMATKNHRHSMSLDLCEKSKGHASFKAMMDQEVIPKVVRNSRIACCTSHFPTKFDVGQSTHGMNC